jgi:hypothetical protein
MSSRKEEEPIVTELIVNGDDDTQHDVTLDRLLMLLPKPASKDFPIITGNSASDYGGLPSAWRIGDDLPSPLDAKPNSFNMA